MSFDRKAAPGWHQEVPGSRWFNADLHVHTIDDLPGGRAKMPAGIQGEASDPKVLREYARTFLQGAVRAGVQVLGLTPHATKVGDGPETSAVWQIVGVWNDDEDDDGVPFREKIYAVFPGFEPNVNDGGSGVHLLFLFDPEIGREQYLSLFEAVMDGRVPWDRGDLQLTSRDAKGVFETIDARRDESRAGEQPWDYLALAPHFQNHHGVLGEVKKQVLETFPCHRLAGYELGDDKLPEDFDESKKPGLFLLPFMEEHRQAFFHGSDAYKVSGADDPEEDELGHRTTWVKLASPRIEALRQAFIARESRLRIAHERDGNGSLRPLSDPPHAPPGKRPWLRRVTIRGEAAFFGGRDDDGAREVTVDLSPDLTCIIGGSMTGKSTLLDGLRVFIDAEMPSDERLLEDVEARGRGRFLAGQPEITLDTPGCGTGAPHERWPAVFFSQSELQRLVQGPGQVEDILALLVPGEKNDIQKRNARLDDLDRELSRQARTLGDLVDQRAEAEQQLAAARKAKADLETFKQAGLATMQESERLQGNIDRVSKHAGDIRQQIDAVADALAETALDADTEAGIRACLQRLEEPLPEEELGALHTGAVAATQKAAAAISRWAVELSRVLDVVSRAVVIDRKAVEKKLAELGHGAEKLAEFQALSRRAGLTTSYKAAHEGVESQLRKAQESFDKNRAEREQLVEEQREAFDRVKAAVEGQFDERIKVRRIDVGISDELEGFLQDLKQKGITRWWNDVEPARRPSPDQLFNKLQAGQLSDLGVSPTVEERFQEVLTKAKRYELQALRSPDRYVLELRVGDSEYREASRLSGGRRVSLLLTLLLEAHDEKPLVIDQPEDELDNRFLWETVLPALRRLKGRRQVIVATHNANIVVNGDADLVVQLEADADHGNVAVSGAIEDPAVRTAIVETVDGGEKAFELRKAKYGF